MSIETKTKSILETFTKVAPSKICKPSWEAEQKKKKQLSTCFGVFKDPNHKPAPYKEKGLFAKKFIPAGTYLGQYGPCEPFSAAALFSKKSRHILITVFNKKENEAVMYKPSNDLKYINHSKEFNVTIGDAGKFYAARDIEIGEELSWYYGDDFEQSLKVS